MGMDYYETMDFIRQAEDLSPLGTLMLLWHVIDHMVIPENFGDRLLDVLPARTAFLAWVNREIGAVIDTCEAGEDDVPRI